MARLAPNGAPPEAGGYIQVANPLNRNQEYMRQTLMNTSLETVAYNLRFTPRVAIFEVACVYLPVEDQALPAQPRRLSVALTGPREARSWLTNTSAPMDFYDLKGVIETLCAHLGVKGASYAPTQHQTFHPGRVASIKIGEDEIGVFGEVHPVVRSQFDIPDQAVMLLELDLEKRWPPPTASGAFSQSRGCRRSTST